MTPLEMQGAAARRSAPALTVAGTELKNRALNAIAEALDKERDVWLSENEKDMAAAKASGTSDALLDRLLLTSARSDGIIEGVHQVASLPDPIGDVIEETDRPNGLHIEKVRVPLGVIGIIYEARPNVTVDAAVLCLKAGNPCILRGGKEAFRSNQAVVSIMRGALQHAGLPADCIQLVQDTSRESANELMHLTEYVDVLIPRGGKGLIRSVTENASVPVIRTGDGVCHVYVEKSADPEMAARIAHNAKCSRPSVCNACECVVLQEDIAAPFLEKAMPLLNQNHVELRCDEASLAAAKRIAEQSPDETGFLTLRAASPEDWDTEFGDYTLAVKTVKDTAEAIAFISAHSTQHSEAIVTEDKKSADAFVLAIDAAAVYVNASTRFTDGGEFGLGAEIGISTQKMHARGPMGLREITSYKYIVRGSGQIR